MINYPTLLQPNSNEKIQLPSSGMCVELPKVTTRFHQWQGVAPGKTYGRKPVLELNGKCFFAELAILRLFEEIGWDGRWIDTYGRKHRIGYWDHEAVKDLPPQKQEFLDAIRRKAELRGGCFDVFCWKDEEVCFAEAKRHGKDKIRISQKRWLEAALDMGLQPKQFLIVEWTMN